MVAMLVLRHPCKLQKYVSTFKSSQLIMKANVVEPGPCDSRNINNIRTKPWGNTFTRLSIIMMRILNVSDVVSIGAKKVPNSLANKKIRFVFTD